VRKSTRKRPSKILYTTRPREVKKGIPGARCRFSPSLIEKQPSSFRISMSFRGGPLETSRALEGCQSVIYTRRFGFVWNWHQQLIGKIQGKKDKYKEYKRSEPEKSEIWKGERRIYTAPRPPSPRLSLKGCSTNVV